MIRFVGNPPINPPPEQLAQMARAKSEIMSDARIGASKLVTGYGKGK